MIDAFTSIPFFYFTDVSPPPPKPNPKRYKSKNARAPVCSDVPIPLPPSNKQSSAGDTQIAKTLKVLRYYRAIKVFKMFQLLKLLNRWSILNEIAIFGFLKVAALVFLVAHFGSCFFTLVAVIDGGGEGYFDVDSWPYRHFQLEHIHEMTFKHLWLKGIYFSMVTLSSTGYGDITPRTTLEVTFCCVLILIGSLVFGIIVANSLLIAQPDEATVQYDNKMRKLERYLANSALPPDLRRALRAHFEFM